VEAAVDCLGGQPPLPVPPAPPPKAGGDMPAEDPLVEASRALQDAWRAASVVLRRAEPLLRGTNIPGATVAQQGGIASSTADAPAEETQAFFAQAVEQGNCCVDCDHYDAPWASVSMGAYLCVDCAGKHRGLGVHISFVRSTTMDQWSKQQLKRMQMGGTKQLQEFFRGYADIRDAPTTKAALTTRYSSRAAGYYRRLLDARCRDSPEEAAAEEAQLTPPTPGEGHLPDATTTVAQSVTSSGGTGGAGTSASSGSLADDSESGAGSLEEEREALRQLMLKHTREGDSPNSPSHRSRLSSPADDSSGSTAATSAAPTQAGAGTKAGAAAAAAASVAAATAAAASAAAAAVTASRSPTAAAAAAATPATPATLSATLVAGPPAFIPAPRAAAPRPEAMVAPMQAPARPPAQTDDSEGGI